MLTTAANFVRQGSLNKFEFLCTVREIDSYFSRIFFLIQELEPFLTVHKNDFQNYDSDRMKLQLNYISTKKNPISYEFVLLYLFFPLRFCGVLPLVVFFPRPLLLHKARFVFLPIEWASPGASGVPRPPALPLGRGGTATPEAHIPNKQPPASQITSRHFYSRHLLQLYLERVFCQLPSPSPPPPLPSQASVLPLTMMVGGVLLLPLIASFFVLSFIQQLFFLVIFPAFQLTRGRRGVPLTML